MIFYFSLLLLLSSIDAFRNGGRAAVYLDAADPHGYAIGEAEVVYWGLCPGCSTAHRS